MFYRDVRHPQAAIVYEGVTGRLIRKILPGVGEVTPVNVLPGENVIILNHPPYDDETCRAAVRSIVGVII